MKISIITVCLNSERTIEQTIQSVVNQNYLDVEYIIVDGGSTDKTLEIIKKYRDEIAVVVSEPDEGIYDAMNKGIVLATGDIIGIINSDDWYEMGVFEYVVKQYEDEETEVLYANANMIDDNKVVSQWNYIEIEKLMYKMVIPHPTVFIKKEIYVTHGRFNTKYKISADYDLMLRLYVNGVKFKYCNKTFVNFRTNGASYQNEEIIIRDSRNISVKHLEGLEEERKEKWLPIIENNYKVSCLWNRLNTNQEQIIKVLTEKYQIGQTQFVLWGAGKGGNLMCDILCGKNFAPSFVVDSDPKCWNICMNGIEVVAPESLKNYNGYVFIMVKFHSQEIAEYIERMNNPNLTVVRWEELVE